MMRRRPWCGREVSWINGSAASADLIPTSSHKDVEIPMRFVGKDLRGDASLRSAWCLYSHDLRTRLDTALL